MNIRAWTACIVVCLACTACKREWHEKPEIPEDPGTFKEQALIRLGGEASAEIAAYDQLSKLLFVVNNEAAAKVDVIALENFPAVTKIQSLDFSGISGGANSVAVHQGLLAVALEGINKQVSYQKITAKINIIKEVFLSNWFYERQEI